MFLTIVMILLTVGLIMLFSSSYVYAYYNRNGNGAFFFVNQLVYAVLGLAVMFAITKFDYAILRKLALPIMIVSVGLLCLVLAYHTDRGNFKRWMEVGPVTIQPSEIAKIALVIFLAWSMERHRREIVGKNPIGIKGWKRLFYIKNVTTVKNGQKVAKNKMILSPASKSFWWTVFYAAVIAVVCVLVFLEHHLSGTILIFVLGVSMMCFGEVPMKWFALGIGVVLTAVLTVYLVKPELLEKIFADYMEERIVAWRNKEYEPHGALAG